MKNQTKPAAHGLKEITESQFYMWRTIFAMAHADGVVTDEEVHFMAEALEDIPFSHDQKAILNDDIKNAQDIVEMFRKISDHADQAKFFQFARGIVHVDGDYGAAEQAMMLKLEKVHLEQTNVDDLIGSIDLEFDDGSGVKPLKKRKPSETKNIIFSFREHFLKSK